MLFHRPGPTRPDTADNPILEATSRRGGPLQIRLRSILYSKYRSTILSLIAHLYPATNFIPPRYARKCLIEESASSNIREKQRREKERERERGEREREREIQSLWQQSHARRQPLPTNRKPLLALTSKPTAARRTLVVLCCASK